MWSKHAVKKLFKFKNYYFFINQALIYFSRAVSFFLNITQFAIGTTFLLLTSRSLQNFVKNTTGKELDMCKIIVVITFAMVPIILLKSPNDFWYK